MSAVEDAHALHHAIAGLGTDDQKVVDIICHRTHEQLVSIAAAYQEKYGKSLDSAIKGDTSGNYRKLLRSLVKPRHVFYANSIRKAVKGLGTSEGALIDVLAFASNHDLKKTIDAYYNLYKKDLVEDVKDDTSGNYKHTLEALLRATRDEARFDPNTQNHQAEKDAHDLYKKGEGRLGTNDDFFVGFFTSHSESYIQAVSHHYNLKHKHGLAEAVKKETSGDFCRVLEALATPRAVYFAKRLHQAIQGLGTNDRLLRRVFVLNNKEQLRAIAAEYQTLYKKSAVDDIKGDTSGWYCKTLQALLN